eukprot:Awhi_evm1s849
MEGGFATYLVGLREGVGRFESIDEYEDFFSEEEEEEEVLLQRVRTRQQATRPNVIRSGVLVPSSGSPQRKSKNYAPSQLKTDRSEGCTGFPRMQVVRKDGKVGSFLKYCERCGNRNTKVAICSLCNRSLCTDNVNSKGSKAEVTDDVVKYMNPYYEDSVTRELYLHTCFSIAHGEFDRENGPIFKSLSKRKRQERSQVHNAPSSFESPPSSSSSSSSSSQ